MGSNESQVSQTPGLDVLAQCLKEFDDDSGHNVVRGDRHRPRRHFDRTWSWPRKLSFVSQEEFQWLPHSIQVMIYEFMFGIRSFSKHNKE